ncbi:MAG: hypothetical protein KBS42_05120 [Bacteroidales bacterium]|nr:hypothetical protein [Candidatus Colicola coprequi]
MLKVKEGSISPNGFTLVQDSIPNETKNYKVKVTAHLANGKTLSPVEYAVKSEYLPIDKITIAGDTNIADHNNHAYVVAFSRADGKTPNVGVKSFSVESNQLSSVLNIQKTDGGFILNVVSGKYPDASVVVTVKATLANDVVISQTFNLAIKFDKGDVAYSGLPSVAEFVDLGLPSGKMWAKCNVGAASETDPGLYFMWGDTEGHEKNSGYNFSSANYSAKGLNAISTDLSISQDAARVNLGGTWRMPTKAEFEELLNNTNVTWTTINGVAGRKFTNKTDASKYIFIPAAGYYNGTTLYNWGTYGDVWSSTFYDSTGAWRLDFNSGGQGVYVSFRYFGLSVRGISDTIPSSKLSFEALGTLHIGITKSGNVPLKSVDVSFKESSTAFEVKNKTLTGFDIECVNLVDEENTIVITVTDMAGNVFTKEVGVSAKEPAPTPVGGDSAPGDVLCSDGTVVKPVIASDGYTVESVDLGGKTPVGVCVIPSSHTDDGKGRYVSLKGMSLSDPENGGAEATMYWGGYGTDLPLTNWNSAQYGYIGTKSSINNMTSLDSDGLYYSSKPHIPNPFNTDGSRNDAYRTNTWRSGDMDGAANTDVIINNVTAVWQTGAISNGNGAGTYPAACCCRRYAPAGFRKGEWYLPASGELGYAVANLKLLNNVLTKVNGNTLTANYYWSSTEYSDNYAIYVYFNNGLVSGSNKDDSYYVRAFLAF